MINLQKIFLVIAIALFPLSAICIDINAVSDIWPPYIINMKKKEGYLVEILNKAFKGEGIELKFRAMTYKKSKEAISKGKADILIGCTDGSGLDGAAVVKVPLAKLHYAFFTNIKHSKWKYQGVPSLAKMKLGVIKGYGYGELDSYINSSNKNIKIYEPKTPLLNLIKDAIAGDIDIFAQDINVTLYTLKKSFNLKSLNISGKLGEKNNLYLCVSKYSKHSSLIFETLTRKLELMEEDGLISKLKSKYNIEN